MLQTFISQIAGRRSWGPGNAAASPSARAGAVVRGRWPRGQAARVGSGCGGAALGFQRPRAAPWGTLPAQPRLCPPCSAPLLLVSSHTPWVTGPRRSRGGAGSYSRLGGCWPFSLTAAAPRPLCSPPLRAAWVPASLSARARRLLPIPAAGGKQAPWPPTLHRADACLWSRAELQERNPRLSVIRSVSFGAF